MATSKPDILLILLQKLMEEGNTLYKVRRSFFWQQNIGLQPEGRLNAFVPPFQLYNLIYYYSISNKTRIIHDFFWY